MIFSSDFTSRLAIVYLEGEVAEAEICWKVHVDLFRQALVRSNAYHNQLRDDRTPFPFLDPALGRRVP